MAICRILQQLTDITIVDDSWMLAYTFLMVTGRLASFERSKYLFLDKWLDLTQTQLIINAAKLLGILLVILYETFVFGKEMYLKHKLPLLLMSNQFKSILF